MMCLLIDTCRNSWYLFWIVLQSAVRARYMYMYMCCSKVWRHKLLSHEKMQSIVWSNLLGRFHHAAEILHQMQLVRGTSHQDMASLRVRPLADKLSVSPFLLKKSSICFMFHLLNKYNVQCTCTLVEVDEGDIFLSLVRRREGACQFGNHPVICEW